MERAAWMGFWLGLMGATLAVVAAVAGSGAPALVAGCCAMAAGAIALRVETRARDAEDRTRVLAEQAANLQREKDAAEQALLSRIESEVAAEPAAPATGVAIEAVTDPVTGLYNETFFRVALDQRVLAARRHLRPVALVLIDVVRSEAGGWSPADPVMVATALRTTLREADTACRLVDGRFALVLEDTPEDGAVWTVERVRRTLLPGRPGLVVWAGVACYPAHAFDAMEVLERASTALIAAREWRRDRIEVAPSPD